MSLTLTKLRGSFPDARVWPSTGTETPTDVGDVFGPRPFAPHIPTVGHDYDWHRGIDLPADQEATTLTPVYAPAEGCVSRLHYGHFSAAVIDAAGHAGWAGQFEEADADGIMSFAAGALNCSYDLGNTVSDASFPASARMRNKTPVHMCGAQDTDLRVWISGSLAALTGDAGCGIAFHDEANDEYVAVDYDGGTLRFHAVDADGADAINGTSAAVADVRWLRILWDQSAGNLLIQYSTTDARDPGTWTTAATFTAPNFTRGQTPTFPAFRWSFYVRKFGASAAAGAIPLAFVGCVDENEDIGRFGNWLQLADGTRTWVLMHFSHLVVGQGAILEKGQLLGYMGREGFDDKSGPILEVHCHAEVIPGSGYYYSNDDPVNPLAPGLLPRANVSNNVGVVRSDANDPNADACFLLTITVTRADQDFDLNTISLTGDVATRTLNWNTRAGLNADSDIPDQDGVYLVPSAFDEDSATYVVAVYFEKAVVGSTFVSAEVLDTEGTELWSEVA